MESDKYPVKIDGQVYYVDRTVGGAPAIFRGDSGVKCIHKGHIHSSELTEQDQFPLQDGDLIIIAKRRE